MGNSNSAPKVSAQDKAILDLKVQRDKLSQYQKRLTILISNAHSAALGALKNKDQRAARLALRRKKFQENILQKTDAQLAQLENLTSEIEFAQVQREVFEGIKKGTGVLAQIRKEMGGVEEVERVMAANEEEREKMREIDDLLADRMTSEEEDEVEEELRRMEEAQGLKTGQLPNVPPVEVQREQLLPDAPTSIGKTKVEERQALPA